MKRQTREFSARPLRNGSQNSFVSRGSRRIKSSQRISAGVSPSSPSLMCSMLHAQLAERSLISGRCLHLLKVVSWHVFWEKTRVRSRWLICTPLFGVAWSLRKKYGLFGRRPHDAQPCNRPERRTASLRSLFGSRRASRAGARSLRTLGISQLNLESFFACARSGSPNHLLCASTESVCVTALPALVSWQVRYA